MPDNYVASDTIKNKEQHVSISCECRVLLSALPPGLTASAG